MMVVEGHLLSMVAHAFCVVLCSPTPPHSLKSTGSPS